MAPDGMHRDPNGHLIPRPPSPEAVREGAVAIQNIWESGTLCSGCKKEFALGEEALYGKCLDCAKGQAEARNESELDTITIASRKLAVPGRLTLTTRQIRELARRVPGEPVSKPDRGRSGPVYSRMPGWSAARVAAGLSAQEVAGLWLDFLTVGKVPPLRHCDLEAVLAAIEDDNAPVTEMVTVA